ncbi:MAG: molybdopterin-dependent oxidoreductase [Coriobacteriia bacterium]|nr:molybdopterin-dependent oxidoreductase [Coriobacteriia bacterium]
MRAGRMTAGLMVLVALLATACSSEPGSGGGPSGTGGPEITELERVQVREYEGKDLSSITDFRENSITGPQDVDRDEYRLKVTGLVTTPLELSYADVLGDRERFKKVVTLNCVEGWSVDILWEGIRLGDLLDAAGARTDANTLIFKAVDGYSSSLPLDYVRDRDILLAYKMNDVELPAERGFPFQVVAEDKFGYKWVKWVVEIEVSDDAEYRGYWESRGFSNSADLDADAYE